MCAYVCEREAASGPFVSQRRDNRHARTPRRVILCWSSRARLLVRRKPPLTQGKCFYVINVLICALRNNRRDKCNTLRRLLVIVYYSRERFNAIFVTVDISRSRERARNHEKRKREGESRHSRSQACVNFPRFFSLLSRARATFSPKFRRGSLQHTFCFTYNVTKEEEEKEGEEDVIDASGQQTSRHVHSVAICATTRGRRDTRGNRPSSGADREPSRNACTPCLLARMRGT